MPTSEEFKRDEIYCGIIETLFILQAIKTRNDDEAEISRWMKALGAVATHNKW